MIYLDTHVVLWLYEGLLNKFPPIVKRHLEHDELIISPMVQLELQYLFEIERIKVKGAEIVKELVEKLAMTISDESFLNLVHSASQLSWTRDPFDRLIVATAKLKNSLLLTKDTHINKHYSKAIWK